MENNDNCYKQPKAISVSEAYQLLSINKDAYMNSRSRNYSVFHQTLEYSENFSKIKDSSTLTLLKSFLEDLKFTKDEIVSLISLAPITISEAKSLIPSILRLEDSIIESALTKLKNENKE